MNADQASAIAAGIVEQVREHLPPGAHVVLVVVADDDANPGRLVEGFATTIPDTGVVVDVLEKDVIPALRASAREESGT